MPRTIWHKLVILARAYFRCCFGGSWHCDRMNLKFLVKRFWKVDEFSQFCDPAKTTWTICILFCCWGTSQEIRWIRNPFTKQKRTRRVTHITHYLRDLFFYSNTVSKQLHACSLALPSVSAVSYGGLQPWHFFKHVFTCPGIVLLAPVLHNSNLLIEEQAARQISSLILPQSFQSFFHLCAWKKWVRQSKVIRRVMYQAI